MKKFLTAVFLISILSTALFMSCTSIPFSPKNLTDGIVALPMGTEGTGGVDGEYMLFGDWPQTVKADYVVIDESKKGNVNGWTCYSGSDNCAYVKAVAKCDGGKFSNGYDIENGKTYYFKMEPIKWRVLSDSYGTVNGKLLLSEKVLDASFFYPEWENIRTINDTEIYVNNYLYSSVRAYLNGLDGRKFDVEDFNGKGFIDKAFSDKAREELLFINSVGMDVELYIDYDISQFSEYELCEKVFLLSEKDIANPDFGFGDYDECGKDSPRLRRATDYAKAMGADVTDESNGCPWWLRSPSELSDEEVREVSNDGYAYNQSLVTNESEGIVPAIFIYK